MKKKDGQRRSKGKWKRKRKRLPTTSVLTFHTLRSITHYLWHWQCCCLWSRKSVWMLWASVGKRPWRAVHAVIHTSKMPDDLQGNSLFSQLISHLVSFSLIFSCWHFTACQSGRQAKVAEICNFINLLREKNNKRSEGERTTRECMAKKNKIKMKIK